MQLFYNATLTNADKEITFSREESKHIAKVLRKKEGDFLSITNGAGTMFVAEITYSNPSQCIAIINSYATEPARNYRLHMAVSPTKMNERYEWFLEKATEIGINEITPIICHHSERKIIKKERLERIIMSAMKQSLQSYLPKLNPAIPFTDFVQNHHNDLLLIAHCEKSDKKKLAEVIEPKKNITILIGPEGDFSKKEIELALSLGYNPITLGKNRLRTETAAIAAVHSVAFINS